MKAIVEGSFYLNHKSIEKAMKFLNKAHLGKETCEGTVPEALTNAHHNIRRSKLIKIEVEIDASGQITPIRIL
jgi:hypothetical protein